MLLPEARAASEPFRVELKALLLSHKLETVAVNAKGEMGVRRKPWSGADCCEDKQPVALLYLFYLANHIKGR
jgi:hypothetical protein